MRTWETSTPTTGHSQHFIQEHLCSVSAHWRHITVGLCFWVIPWHKPLLTWLCGTFLSNNCVSAYEEQLCFSFAKTLHCLYSWEYCVLKEAGLLLTHIVPAEQRSCSADKDRPKSCRKATWLELLSIQLYSNPLPAISPLHNSWITTSSLCAI